MLLKILLRNAFRHKLRTVLTICGIAVAIMAFGLLRTVVSAWYAGVEASSANRLITRNATSLVFPLPLAYKDKIRSIEGVTLVSYGNWFGGVYITERNFFANFAIEPRVYLEQYPEYVLSGQEKEAFLRDRRGCIAGANLARRFNWKVGDNITLKGTIFPGDWELVLRGIYRGREDNINENQFFFHWDYLNESLRKTQPGRADQVGFYVITIAHAQEAAMISDRIDALFRNSFAETHTETEKAFQLGFVSLSEAILTAIRLISLVVIAIIMAVAANTMGMSVRERLGEYAVLKTLGFGNLYVSLIILGESLVIALLGGLMGMAGTFPASQMVGRAVGDYFPVFMVTRQTLCLAFSAALLVGVVASLFPMWRASTVPVAEGLRRVG